MENSTPFSDALNVSPLKREQTEIDILRESNSKLKLELLELKEKLNEIKTILKCD